MRITQALFLKQFLTPLCCILLTWPLIAGAADVAGSSDISELPRYPLSEIVEYSQSVVPQYRLALGRMKKVNGVTSPEPVRYITGHMTRITYEIPPGHSSREAFEYINKQLQDVPHEMLFSCSSRDCGSSNDWANNQFGIAKLYGLERQQYYMAVRLKETDTYIVCYAVQRGNMRVYLHLDVIRQQGNAQAASAASLLQQLQRGERVYVTSSDPGMERLQSLAAALKSLFAKNSFTDVWLVGHQVAANPYVTLQNNSRAQAASLKARLVALGVPEGNLNVVGVGALAPAYNAQIPDNRIELVVE